MTLRPVVADDAADLWDAWEGTAEADWTYLPMERPTGPHETAAIIDAMASDPSTVAYCVLVNGSAAGVLSLMRIDPANGTVEIGAVILGTPLRRTAGSTQAQRLLMGHVLDDLGYRRLEWKCDALNAPSMAAAERLGYTFEGVFRNAVVTKGRNRDTAWWSVTDAEWPALRRRLDAWLDPGNFDADGQQLTRLGR
ncbi:GNAT family N-acetyltransferase [Oryzobacter telluris]|uniref:GNAT family N-acetyltransferase n=1 Tax=Oryzobacter telluris TaxID=3149179 RepID=UPI00370D539D